MGARCAPILFEIEMAAQCAAISICDCGQRREYYLSRAAMYRDEIRHQKETSSFV